MKVTTPRSILITAVAVLMVGGGTYLVSRLRQATPNDSNHPRSAEASPAPTSQQVEKSAEVSPVDTTGTNLPHTPEPVTRPNVFGLHGAVQLEDVPAGRFRDELSRLSESARRYALDKLGRLQVPLNDVASLSVEENGQLFYQCTPPRLPPSPLVASAGNYEAQAGLPGAPVKIEAAAAVPITTPPVRHSRPGATKIIYLDFNGHTISGTAWNLQRGNVGDANYRPAVTTYLAKPLDTDSNPSSFSDAEQAIIINVWERVAEDFKGFDVDVTTEEPATFTANTGRLLITDNVDANGVSLPSSTAAGVAYLDVFGNFNYASTYSPALVYANQNYNYPAYIAEASSHEMGHNLSLSHDGTTAGAEYYYGHGSGDTSWSTLMGGTTFQNVTQWSKGEYYNANNPEDDLAIITGHLGYVPDDHTDSNATATPLTVNGLTVSGAGIISQTGEADRFSFASGAGAITINATTFRSASQSYGGNLDAALELYNAGGSLVASANIDGVTNATLNTTVSGGTYYLRVFGAGSGTPLSSNPSGYTSYGSLGQYTISGTIVSTVPVTPSITTQPTSKALLAGQSTQFAISATGNPIPTFQWQRLPAGSGSWANLSDAGSYTGTITATLSVASSTTAMDGDQFRCVATNSAGTATSNPATLSVSTPTPPAFSSQPANQTVTVGQFATFTVAATGIPAPSYQWQRQVAGSSTWSNLFDSSLYSGSTSNSLTVILTGLGLSGDSFRCIATNSSSNVTSNAVTLTVERNTSPVAAVAMGNRHTLILKTDGALWAAGWNAYGQLGDGTIADRSNPVQIASGVAKIAAGGGTSFFIKSDRTLWAMGWNYVGQLGDNSTTNRLNPVQIAAGVSSVSAGDSHVLFVKLDGTLWGTGINNYGQLGDGTTIERHTPIQIASGVSAVAAGVQQTLFIKTDGTLWASGLNSDGQLGDGTTINRLSPVQVANGVAAVSCSYAYSLFLKTDGTLWGMGINNYGQLGDGTAIERHSPIPIASNVAQISAGFTHALFIKTDSSLWGMGDNYAGALATGVASGTVSIPAQVASNVVKVSAGSSSTAFIKTDGSLWTVGDNTYGNLGDGSSLPYGTWRTVPFEIFGPAQLITAPIITLQPVSQNVAIPGYPLQGGMVIFRTWASGSTTLSFQWLKNGTPVYGATSSNFVLYHVALNDAGSYSVIATNSAGSVTSDVAALTVQAAPSFITQPYGQPVTGGNSATFTAAATSIPAPTYQWRKNGIDIIGATSSSFTIASATAGDTGNYTVVATNSAGSTTSDIATLIVQDPSTAYTFTTLAGTAGSSGSLDGLGSAARFNYPLDVAVDAAGNVYVADLYNHTIRKIAPGGMVTTFAGSAGSSGSTDGTGDAARFIGPVSVAVDSAGNLYVPDSFTIRKISSSGVVTTIAGSSGSYGFINGIGNAARFLDSKDVAVDGAGNVYVIDGAAIRKVTPGGVVTTLAGQPNTSGPNDGVGSAALFSAPYGLGADQAGNVYVADTYNRTIRKIDPSGLVTTFAGTAGVQGGADGIGGAAQFFLPLAIAVDVAGNLYVTDGTHIREITPSRAVTTIAGLFYGSADGKGTAAKFSGARGVAVDGAGNVYVADTENNTIRWGALAPPVLTSATSAGVFFGQSFTYTVVFSGTLSPYSVSGLPAGLGYNPTTRVIAGTPTAAGTFPITLTTINGAGPTTATLTLTVQSTLVAPSAAIISITVE